MSVASVRSIGDRELRLLNNHSAIIAAASSCRFVLKFCFLDEGAMGGRGRVEFDIRFVFDFGHQKFKFKKKLF